MAVSANALVVDDEPSWSEVYQRALWRVGVDRVEVTDTYEGAATAIDAMRFAVAIVDIGLAVDDDTNVDGLRVMEKIRAAATRQASSWSPAGAVGTSSRSSGTR